MIWSLHCSATRSIRFSSACVERGEVKLITLYWFGFFQRLGLCAVPAFKVPENLITMGVKDHPQCYFDVELNREPGKRIESQSTECTCSRFYC